MGLLALIIIRFWHRYFKPGRLASHFRLVDSLMLGKERMVCMVKIADFVLILGVTNYNVTLLKRITDSEFDKMFKQQDDIESRTTKMTFADQYLKQLSKFFKRSNFTKTVTVICIGIVLTFLLGGHAFAATENIIPNIDIKIDGDTEHGGLLNALGILALLTVLTIAPAILILTTSFTRIVIVFSFLRTSLGTQQTPPNQVLVGLALLLTFFVMSPTWTQVNELAISPYVSGEIVAQEAILAGQEPIKHFMLRQTREKDLALFAELSNENIVSSPEEMSLVQIVPAFAISELKTAFEMGFILFLPFLVIDMIVASTLMSMGMLMLPPVLISLPFKLLLFVLVDGWGLITKSLVASFR